MPQHDDHDDPAAQPNFSGARDESGPGSGFDALRAFAPPRAGDDSGAGSGFDALRAFAPAKPEDSGTDLDAARSQTRASAEQKENESDEEDAGQLFTVTNPPRTVAVSALLDGRTERVHLSATATNTSAKQLADEILVLADLARQKGLAGQHTFLLESPDVSELMDVVGLGDSEGREDLREFMEDTIGLVSPKHAEAAQAEAFATRYAHDHD